MIVSERGSPDLDRLEIPPRGSRPDRNTGEHAGLHRLQAHTADVIGEGGIGIIVAGAEKGLGKWSEPFNALTAYAGSVAAAAFHDENERKGGMGAYFVAGSTRQACVAATFPFHFSPTR
jgi:hypothetical protein